MQDKNPRLRLLSRQKIILTRVIVFSSVTLVAVALLFIVFNLTGKKNVIAKNHFSSTLKSFSARKNDASVDLDWTTASEINNDHFIIERSLNGIEYAMLGKVAGAGNSTHDMKHSITDEHPVNGNNYYRLTQVNVDGKSESFSPVVVKFNAKKEEESVLISASPVPFVDHLRIEYYVKVAGVVDFSLLNRLGQVLKTSRTTAGEGMNSLEISDLSLLQNGYYILNMKCKSGETHTLNIAKR